MKIIFFILKPSVLLFDHIGVVVCFLSWQRCSWYSAIIDTVGFLDEL